MKKIFLLLLLLPALSCGALYAQSTLWSTGHAYLGQTPPGDTPIQFAPRLLTIKDSFDMDRVAFSNDGKEFYYETNIGWFNDLASVLRSFVYKDGKWVGPNTVFHRFYSPAFSPDGATMYLRGGGVRDSLHHAFVWQTKRLSSGGWATPSVFLMELYSLYMYMPTRSGAGYVGSNAPKNKVGGMDVCVLHFSPTDTTIESLGAPLNTPGWDGDFYVSPDESYIIISANETKTFECELHISFRRSDHSWTAPVSLGPLINDGLAHRWGQYVSPDGKYLFYSRGTSPKDCHIYWVRFDRLLARMRASAGLATR